MAEVSAAGLLVGDELLSGKVRDANGATLARALFEAGLRLRRLVVCPDEPEAIVEELRRLLAAHDWVFTSGGVGPTHDDVTLVAVAEALERPLRRHEGMEAALRAFFGERFTEAHRRMALLPDGAELLRCEGLPFPVLKVDRVVVLPGVPRFFEAKLAALRPWLRRQGGRPLRSLALDVDADEGRIAPLLAQVAARYPEVAVGSYPRQRADGSWYVRVSCDGADEERVREALGALREALGARWPVQEVADEVGV